jgi:cytochrome c oxidase subunit III
MISSHIPCDVGSRESLETGMALPHSATGVRSPEPAFGGRGRGPTDHWPGGDGGSGGRGGGDDFPSYRERLRRYRMLMAFALGSVVMIFVSFTTAYVVRKAGVVWDAASNEYVSSWAPATLPVRTLLINTFILLMSSLSLEIARRRAEEDVALAPIANMPGIRVSQNRSLPWLWLTVVLGLMFVGGQYVAWEQLRHGGVDPEVSISVGFFFILTGVHAVHLMGGILALLYAGMTSLLRRPPETRRIVVDVTAWYWHFMGVLWLYVFGLLYFAR